MSEWFDWLMGSLSNIWSSPGIFVAAVMDFIIIFALIYALLYFLRGTRSANVLFGVTAFLAIAAILADFAQLVVMSFLLSAVWPILGVAVIVIFQPEIRRVFAQAGSMFSHRKIEKDALTEISKAAYVMASSRTGALIVFERTIGLEGVINTSVKLDAKVNSMLLQSIFFKNSPLHDCAVIVRKNRIVAARAVLPLTQEEMVIDSHRNFGTRHRAAVGITEETDAAALVVSEETGAVSIAFKGRFTSCSGEEDLLKKLSDLLIEKPQQETVPFWKRMLALIRESQTKKDDKEQ